ncbi:MAG: hypothetical protein WBP61_19850 [Nocardioides sp.]
MHTNPLITGALAVVATTSLIGLGGAADAAEPTTTRERGIVIECSGEHRGRPVYTSVYENNTVKNSVQILVGDDDRQVGGNRESAAPFRTGKQVHAAARIGGSRAVIDGTARAVGRKTLVHEEHADAGELITIDGTHRRLRTALTLAWRGRVVPLDCAESFVYDLQVTHESAVD